jgi:hypothetical protein
MRVLSHTTPRLGRRVPQESVERRVERMLERLAKGGEIAPRASFSEPTADMAEGYNRSNDDGTPLAALVIRDIREQCYENP